MVEIDTKWMEHTLKTKGFDVNKIISIKSELAVADGENYISKIYRLSIEAALTDGNKKNISIILKKKMRMDFGNEELEKAVEEVFVKEYNIYVDVLEKLEKYLPNKKKIWADALGLYNQGEIYFEDLKETGYKVGNRHTGLDLDHFRIFTENLARFHAASYIAIERGETDTAPYSKYVMLGTVSDTKKWKSNELELMVDVIRTEWGPEWSSTADRLEQYKDKLQDILLDLGKYDENRLNVFCHGDAWVNNFMYRYNSDGKPDALKFVDFQVFHYNSFGFDWLYFLNSSLHWSTKQDNITDMIKLYCDTFNQILDQFGSTKQRQSPEIVLKEMDRLSPWGLAVSLRIRPIIMAPPEYAMKISEMMQDQTVSGKKRRFYVHPTYVEIMKVDLPKLLDTMEKYYSKNKL